MCRAAQQIFAILLHDTEGNITNYSSDDVIALQSLVTGKF